MLNPPPMAWELAVGAPCEIDPPPIVFAVQLGYAGARFSFRGGVKLMQPGPDAVGIRGVMPPYNKPEPLSAEAHGQLTLKRIDRPFAFMGKLHLSPLSIGEFGFATSSFPIIFLGDSKAPAAVMGARTEENVFITPDGELDPEVYVPTFVRQYPFVFANDPANDRLVVCIDRQAPMLGVGGEVPLFENGQPTQYTQNAIEMLKEVERQRRMTLEFVRVMQDLDLFETKTITFQPTDDKGATSGEPQKVAEFFQVSEKKLNELSTDAYLRLRDRGAIPAIYAHLLSQMHWSKIINRVIRRAMAAQPAAAQMN